MLGGARGAMFRGAEEMSLSSTLSHPHLSFVTW